MYFFYFKLSRLKKELQSYNEEKDNAVLEREMFINRIKHLEGELESQQNTFNGRARDIRSMEASVPISIGFTAREHSRTSFALQYTINETVRC